MSHLKWIHQGCVVAAGEENMRVDTKMLADVESARAKAPLLRFYQWKLPTVSLGFNQEPATAVNIAQLGKLGYDLVTRPTGGRALLHKGDLCYALAARREWHPEFRSLTSTYRTIGKAIRLALLNLGVKLVELEPGQSHSRAKDEPCFAMRSPFEVAVAGRKICGSAQRRLRQGFLQHGSIRLADTWTADDLQAVWPQAVEIPESSTTSLEIVLGRLTDVEEVVKTLTLAFGDTFQIEIRRNTTE